MSIKSSYLSVRQFRPTDKSDLLSGISFSRYIYGFMKSILSINQKNYRNCGLNSIILSLPSDRSANPHILQNQCIA